MEPGRYHVPFGDVRVAIPAVLPGREVEHVAGHVLALGLTSVGRVGTEPRDATHLRMRRRDEKVAYRGQRITARDVNDRIDVRAVFPDRIVPALVFTGLYLPHGVRVHRQVLA